MTMAGQPSSSRQSYYPALLQRSNKYKNLCVFIGGVEGGKGEAILQYGYFWYQVEPLLCQLEL